MDNRKNSEIVKDALQRHIDMKAEMSLEKYGVIKDLEGLMKILLDNNITRYPTNIVFDDKALEKGAAVSLQKIPDDLDDGYCVYLHPMFREREAAVVALVLNMITSVNYGKVAKKNEAIRFASALTGMEKDEFARLIDVLNEEVVSLDNSGASIT